MKTADTAVPYCQQCGSVWANGATVSLREDGAHYRCRCGHYYRVRDGVLIQHVGNHTTKIRLLEE